MTEVIVSEKVCRSRIISVEGPEVVELSLVTVLRGHAIVAGSGDLGKGLLFLLGDV